MLYVSKKETKGEQMATKKPAGLDFKHKQIQRGLVWTEGGRPIEESHLDKVRDLRNGK